MTNNDIYINFKKNLLNDNDNIKDNEDTNYLHELYKTRVKEANEITDLYVKISESIRDRLASLRHKYDTKSEEREEEKEDEPIEKKKVKKMTKKEKEKLESQKIEAEPMENIIDKIEKEEEPKDNSKKEITEVPAKRKGRKKKDEE
jgi:hypothetical protein